MLPELEQARDAIVFYVALPLVVAAGLATTWVLKGPQLAKLGEAFRALRSSSADDPAETTTSAAVWLASASSIGVAAAIGAATSVALGAAGVLFWVWVIGFVVAPLRYAEVVLARTAVPGQAARGARGSLAGRLAADSGWARGAGLCLAALVVVSAFAFVGGVHGAALLDVAGTLLPASAEVIGYGVAAVAGLFVILGLRRGGAVAGWLALAAVIVLLLTGAISALVDPDRAFGALGRAFAEAFGGAPEAGPFSGALASEVLAAAALHAVLPLVATTGVDGALHAAARAESTKQQAAAAMLAPFLFAALTTVLVIAFLATGAHFRRVETTRTFDQVIVYGVAFESVSQRLEPERRHDGYMRVIDGELRDISLELATDRGIIRRPRFEEHGRPANFAIHFDDGKPMRLLRSRDGTLDDANVAEVRNIVVTGEMLPQGGGLFAAALERGTGGDIGGRVALAALLVLGAIGAVAFGFGASRSLPVPVPVWATIAIALLPAAGLALATSGYAPWLEPLGGLTAAIAASIAAVAIAAKSRQAR